MLARARYCVFILLASVALGSAACERRLDSVASEPPGWSAPLPAPKLELLRRRPRGAWIRSHARPTRLVRHGPSPQRWREPEPPPGVERVSYRSDGLALGAWLAVPPGYRPDEPMPAVVYFHGWFSLRADAWAGAQRFVDRGFVVLMPMLRGENDNPGEFEMFYGELDDAAAAVRWLALRPEVDQRRLYAFGHSVGGGIAGLLSLVPDLPLVSTASCGGVYIDEIFDTWRGILPFDRDDTREVKARLLRPNLREMQRPHHAYVGRSDAVLRFARLMAEAAAVQPRARFTLDLVDGDHFSSLPRAIDAFIARVLEPRGAVEASAPRVLASP